MRVSTIITCQWCGASLETNEYGESIGAKWNDRHTFDDNDEDFVYQHGRSNKFTAHCPACSTIFFANDICEESAEKAFKKWIHLNESMTEDDVRNLKIDVGMYQVLLYIENNLIELLDNE